MGMHDDYQSSQIQEIMGSTSYLAALKRELGLQASIKGIDLTCVREKEKVLGIQWQTVVKIYSLCAIEDL